MSDWVAIGIAALALVFTVTSWWWMNSRRGKLRSYDPHSFAYIGGPMALRIRLPLVLENTGPTPIIVQNFRLHFPEERDALLPIPWSNTRNTIRPGTGDGEELPAVFAVDGRTAVRKFVEFAAPFPGVDLQARTYDVQVDVALGHKHGWTKLIRFPLYADRITAPEQFIAYSNGPHMPTSEDLAKSEASFRRLLNDLGGGESH